MKTTAIHTKQCDQKGCDYVARHRKEAVVNRMMGCHKSRTHGVRSEAAIYNDKYRRRMGVKVGAIFGKRFVETLRTMPDGVVKTNGQHISGSSNGPIPVKTKRPYKARKTAISVAADETFHETRQPQTSAVVPAYLCECPNCKTRFYMAKGE